jgi:hypothetical protein
MIRPVLLAGLVLTVGARASEAEFLLQLESQARVRSSLPGDVGTGATADVELLPVGGVRVQVAPVAFELAYRPTFVFRDLLAPGPLVALHRADAAVAWQQAGTLVRLSSEGARGQVDLGPLLALDGTPVGQVAPGSTLGLVDYVRSSTTLAVSQRVSPLLLLRAEGTYQVSGSPQSTGLPLQWGPSGLLQALWELTPVDHFVTTASVQHAEFVTLQRQTLGQATQAWKHALTPVLDFELVGGLAVVQQYAPDLGAVAAHTSVDVEPVLGVTALDTLQVRGSVLGLRGHVGLAPFADRFTATVYERLETTVGATWALRSTLTMSIAASMARSFPRAESATPADLLVGGETSTVWALQPWLSVGAALRAVHVEALTSGAVSQNQWLASVSLTLHDREHTSWK